MARIESQAIGGYYPTSAHLLPRIAKLFDTDQGEMSILDPCAGEGEAVFTLAQEWANKGAQVYACEMEAGRHSVLVKTAQDYTWSNASRMLHGDAFRVSFEVDDGVSVLYLNPPYDFDPVHGRLEEKFLARFTPAVREGGALLFVVPFHALKASAETLAREYENVQCFKFPSPDFEVYKQVVLYARKCAPRLEPDGAILSRIGHWADPEGPSIPELPERPIAPKPVTERYATALSTWKIREVDVTALLQKCRPWTQTLRAGGSIQVANVIPELPVQDLLLRQYTMATPPRPAHIAAGIASGLFNGSRIESTNPVLPPLLVKGVFDREYRTVEEKRNKDGEVKAVVQVQQPKLVTTILDLSTHKYHVLKSDAVESKTLDVASLTVADLLKHYGSSLMGVMETQCPILYDPRKDGASVNLPSSPRKLFAAQAHASKAIVKLLGGNKLARAKRRGKAAILLGEIGSGKSTVSTMAAKAIGAKRLLVLCPPHLLAGWTDEIGKIAPDAEVRVLQSVTDVDDVATAPADKMVISILSRETAKLSHGWDGAGSVCPRCGDVTPSIDLAKKRARCEARQLIPQKPIARAAVALARKLARYAPKDSTIVSLLRTRVDRAMLERYGDGTPGGGFKPGDLHEVLTLLLAKLEKSGERVQRAIVLSLLASESNRILDVVAAVKDDYFAQGVALMLSPDDGRLQAIIDERSKSADRWYNPWSRFEDRRHSAKEYSERAGSLSLSWKTGQLVVDEMQAGTLKASLAALAAIASCGQFGWSEECGEILFQASPSPRRVALAGYIAKHHPDLFDCLILDEGHEYATDGSAQERSAHRLTSLGIPTILMTGSIMNGYAASLFTNMWALSPAFRAEFARDEGQRFIDRYGYRKRLLEQRDQETGEVVEYGSHSDRVTTNERVIGNAPGVLPLFLLRHLLPIAVTLHKTDLAIDLPPCRHFVEKVNPGAELMSRYTKLQTRLVAQIRCDMFKPDVAGRLWGQLAEIPSYLDRATADTGNTDEGIYEIAYPESVGGQTVVSQDPFPADTLLPKEEWMLALVEKELAEGRNVLLFSWHVTLLPRLSRLISERIGETVPVLYSDKVPTGKRQAWIDREVLKKKRRVLVVNPVAVQTGLNNLVHFATEIWMENPACNPVVYRQAIGRVDRIGQTKETRIFFPVYDGTLQAQLYDLLMQKVAVSISTDGLDPESALQAAGVGEDSYLAGLSIGKQLWKLLAEDAFAEVA